tara:strand:- start:1605 stop:2285 length:681 start_codon:yes stop_codon:yes gene_type:complete
MFNKIRNKLHVLHSIYIKHRYFKKRKTYSLDGEDLIISEYFKNKDKGLYVDIGCYHPVHRNNTFLLHKKGWRGVNVDIHKFSIDLFNHIRPNDDNYNFAVSNRNEIINMYYQKELSQLSTTDFDQAKKAFQGPIKEKKIQAYTLDQILDFSKTKLEKIDFLDIDVEGADFKVLQGLSFKKYKPQLICVEIHDKNIINSESYKFLNNHNYELIWSGIFSHIFKFNNF